MSKYSLISEVIGEKRYQSLRLFGIQERTFIRLLALFLVLAAVFYPYPKIAMWLGFMLAGYSAIANDSIQSIGTFIASNGDQKWWKLWLYIGGIFVVTVFYSWIMYDGDVSFQRLNSKGFSESPTEFHFLQIVAPIILLFITRLRMPVSTTFMLLSCFSSSSEGIIGVTEKSLLGYFIAFTVAFLIWYSFSGLLNRLVRGESHPFWRTAQWLISGWLWSMWITHDAANIAIFLNRSLGVWDFIFFASFIFLGLGILFYLRGDKIQSIVKEKSQVEDVRTASVIDLVYALILFVFKEWSNIPMSTTWIFLGLLGGREIAIQFSKNLSTGRSAGFTFKMIGRDILYATIGLIISILIALAVNPNLQKELFGFD
ncbi:MAG: hypothetical protein R3277_01385 [Brumimicrobium sp.]|nr:hypothetical protein [Brumimicrobium sp.]